MKRAIRG
ncbi:hypothetical protein N499_0732A, partial [Wolbachia pipientis wVitA]